VRVGKTHTHGSISTTTACRTTGFVTSSLPTTSTGVRLFDGAECMVKHPRTFDKRAQVENPAHLEALRPQKKHARQARGMDRLRHEAPSRATLLEGAAEPGHNLGSAVAALCRLLDTWNAKALESAIIEAISADRLHVAAVRQALVQCAQAASVDPIQLSDDDRVKELHVEPHDLGGYDQEVSS
jgi:hypothetical protein